ncbi:MAG: hypothetical protein AAFR96_01960 [Planctomycetota bacterium]
MKTSIMAILVLTSGPTSAQPRLEVVGNPLAGTGFTPLGFAGGSNLLGIREHADGGWEYAEATPTGVEVFDFAHIDPSRPRASRIRGDWFLLPGTDPTRRDHVIAATRDGGLNEAWSPFDGSRLVGSWLTNDGRIVGANYVDELGTPLNWDSILVFSEGDVRRVPNTAGRVPSGVATDGRVLSRALVTGQPGLVSLADGSFEEFEATYDFATDIVIPFESVSAHGVVLGDIDAVGNSSADSVYTHVDGVTTVLEFAPTVDRSELVDANRNGFAIGEYWDFTLADQNAQDWIRSALWVDGELFNFRDIVELPAGFAAGSLLSLSDSNEILATVGTPAGPEFVVVRVIPSPGSAVLGLPALLMAARRRH